MHLLHVLERYHNLLHYVAHAVDIPLMHQLECNRWGQHMHHGYYEPGKQVGNQQAQIDMIERTLDWAGVTAVKNVSDVVKGLHTARISTTHGVAPPGRHSIRDASDGLLPHADCGRGLWHWWQQPAHCGKVRQLGQGHHPQPSPGAGALAVHSCDAIWSELAPQ